MLVYKNYDAYFSSVHVGTEVYPGLLIEKTCSEIDLSSEGLDPAFVQGASDLIIQGVRQNPVMHSQIKGEINPFVAGNAQAGRYKGIYNSDLLVSGEAVTGNCEQIVNMGDRIEITTCYLHNDSPIMSLFHLYSAEKVPYGVGSRIRYFFTALICYVRNGTVVPVINAPFSMWYNEGFNPYKTYDAAYIKSYIPESTKIQSTNDCLKCYLENKSGPYMGVSPLMRTRTSLIFNPSSK